MRTILTAALAAILAACGGGGSSPTSQTADAGQECRTVTDSIGTIIAADGTITPGSTTERRLCCSTGFKVVTVAPSTANGVTSNGSVTNVCGP